MSIIRYAALAQPWALHRELVGEVNRLIERNATAQEAVTPSWTPAVDIHEYADRYELHADIPGVDPASIDITLERGILTLSGERAATQATAERQRNERASGKFERRFTLPETVDAEGVSASGKLGVLQIVIPKRAQEQARKISITH
ncbi:MAG: Hsp20/alpha crystallin family protein [Pseudomonadota bacterium]|nr:Hsp20/alpha crystallin family protein [Pseudomonadota bacterium]